jgi:hypothetical protein
LTPEPTNRSRGEHAVDHELFDLTRAKLMAEYNSGWNSTVSAVMKRQTLGKILYYNEIYQHIVNVPGIVCEFGVQWGATSALLTNLRATYEPYNFLRKFVGFDTFSGFPSVDDKDGAAVHVGDLAVPAGHEDTLWKILQIHEANAPLPHIQKFDLIKGDAAETVPAWLDRNPQAVIALAIFDMDLYEPTKAVFEAVLPRLTRGSVLVFDELNHPEFPGETTAVQEIIGLNKLRLRRSPHYSFGSWAVFGE